MRPKPICASFPSVRTNLIMQLCACNVHEHNACQDDWGVKKVFYIVSPETAPEFGCSCDKLMAAALYAFTPAPLPLQSITD
jgi:hypothetical protein